MARRSKLLSACFLILLTLVVLILSRHVSASGINLLAVSETESGYRGSVVHLDLEVLPGTGRILINTDPLTRTDTQISFRIATQIACAEANVDCSMLDFIYSLDSRSSLVSGPSAGAAVSALAYSRLKGYSLREDAALTGTINAGGIIGPVDGIREKIAAASKNNITLVLIPKISFEIEPEDQKNSSANLSGLNSEVIEDFGYSLGVKVIRVSNLYEALSYLSSDFNKKSGYSEPTIVQDSKYSEIMRNISEELCSETSHLLNEAAHPNSTTEYISALNLSRRAAEDYSLGMYYSSASRCFGANLKLRALLTSKSSPTPEELILRFDSAFSSLKSVRDSLPSKYSTAEDLQTYMIVSSRLDEAEKYLKDARISIIEKNYTEALTSISYAEERIKSAVLWKRFFALSGRKVLITKEKLQEACISKLGEAQNSYEYAEMIYPEYLNSTKEKIEDALSDLKNGDYALCLYRAAIAKSEADSFLLLSGLRNENITPYISARIDAAKRAIANNQKSGISPVIGLSYYEYSVSLINDSPSSSLIYAGYALELSNLSPYLFGKKEIPKQLIISILLLVSTFSAGFFSALLLVLIISRRRRNILGMQSIKLQGGLNSKKRLKETLVKNHSRRH